MSRSRNLIVLVLILSLAASAALRDVAGHYRPGAVARRSHGQAAQARSSLAGMNSFALALLLGGLRGPLVMILWAQSEAQKSSRDLEGIDTQIEWIRLLQPEFDSVHIFQMWNKAYNLSAQMATVSNKYSAILDALDYGISMDRERPDNINVLMEIARVYSDKLGGSMEKAYYRKRVREETLSAKVRVLLPASRVEDLRQAARQAGVDESQVQIVVNSQKPVAAATMDQPTARKIKPLFSGEGIKYQDRSRQLRDRSDPAWRRVAMDPMLDPEGNILPELVDPAYPQATDGYDGSELQFLKPYQPFPYGLSPNALGYNYYKRGQMLQEHWKQTHIQLSDVVVNSRPALTMKIWSEEECERGRQAELRAFGMPVPLDRAELELAAAGLKLDALQRMGPRATAASSAEALYSYHLAARLCHDSIDEYQGHLSDPEQRINVPTYVQHINHMTGIEGMCNGDHDYLKAMSVSGAARAALLASARQGYEQAIAAFQLYIMRYAVEDTIAAQVFPQGVNRVNIQALSVAQRAELFQRLDIFIQARGGQDPRQEDRQEYDRYIQRASQRLAQIGG